jgi:hypothetical protein
MAVVLAVSILGRRGDDLMGEEMLAMAWAATEGR